MDLLYANIQDVKEYASNPRQHSEQQIQEIATSIEHFGWKAPILIDSTMTIISGHGRYKAAKLLGMEKIPAVQTGKLSQEDRAAYVIADNRLAEKSSWSVELLQLELDDLQAAEFDMSLTGFDIDMQIMDFEPSISNDEFEVEDGEEVSESDVARKKTDEGYTEFAVVMQQENKTLLVSRLNQIKRDHSVSSNEDALMIIVLDV